MANAASGMAVDDECKLKFLELKAKRNYRYITFKIVDHKVGVDKLGGPDESYEAFTSSLPCDECRYAVFDFHHQRELPEEQDFLHCMVPGHSDGANEDGVCKLKG